MTAIRRIQRALTLLASAAFLVAITLVSPDSSHAALASTLASSGSTGFDVSYPQCSNVQIPDQVTIGAPYQFGVIGVNHGRAFTTNSCLADEYRYVAGSGASVALVMNLNSPRGTALGQADPAGNCTPGDQSCLSYQYGWNAAQYSYQYAQETLRSLGEASVPSAWWMDIEIANYWSRDLSLNDQVIQGAIDFFARTVADSTIGIYTVRSNWNRIAGASYQPGVPVWLAGARSLGSASRLCDQYSPTGGPVTLIQYATRYLDVDYAC